MADAIKRFFEKRKRDLVFKTAGAGHKLTDDTRTVVVSSGSKGATGGSPKQPRPRSELSEEKRMAAEAALARTSQPKPGSASASGGANKMSSMKQQLLAEQKQAEKALKDAARYAEGPREVELETSPVVSGAFFRCPFVGEDVVLPKDEMERAIEECLTAQLLDEPAIISSLMIQTLNRNTELVTLCITTICNIIDNIVKNPDEKKYRKMKCSSKTLNDKVFPLTGASEFLQAVGFQRKPFPVQDGSDVMEDHLVFDSECSDDLERLRSGREILTEAKPIRSVLARCTKAFRIGDKSSAASTSITVPSDFYAITAEELQREAKVRAEAVEQLGMLRTKQMRERDRLRELRRYRYSLIRVKFPDNTLAQATFGTAERFLAVKEWLSAEVLLHSWIPYTLTVTGGKRVDGDETSTLAELDLAPACYLNFAYDASVVADIVADGGKGTEGAYSAKDGYIKQELMLEAEIL